MMIPVLPLAELSTAMSVLAHQGYATSAMRDIIEVSMGALAMITDALQEAQSQRLPLTHSPKSTNA